MITLNRNLDVRFVTIPRGTELIGLYDHTRDGVQGYRTSAYVEGIKVLFWVPRDAVEVTPEYPNAKR